MKKLFYGMAALTMLFTSCESDQNPAIEQEAQIDMSDFIVYTNADLDESAKANDNSRSGNFNRCYTMTNLNRLLSENPGLEQKMYAIEYNTRKFIAAKGKPGGGGGPGGGGTTDSDNDGIPDSADACPNDPAPGTIDGCPPTTYQSITIPVVFNILEDFIGQVTDGQINSQIAILNEDFNNNNPRTDNIPSEFANTVADFKITFTKGPVNRKISTKSTWGTNDAMKYLSQGGINATDPSTYLNIWVCEIGGGILGYAQFPGGPSATDGVVIGPDYFGENTNGGVYGHGRTATHEVGHWLNLRHIWGDGPCKFDDYVADTPSSDGPNYGCPTYPTVNCRSNDMTMNYMDYTYDNCMYMFTNGQNDRAHAVFAPGGERAAMAN